MTRNPAGRGMAALLEPVVVRAGFDLESLDVTPAGRRRVVRVVVDRDGGVSLDDVAELSRELSAALDAADAADGAAGAAGAERSAGVPRGAYVLEVTSPGVDRPLTLPRHWRRAIGHLVTATVRDPGGSATLTGRVTDADDAAARFDTGGDAGQVEIAYADVIRARVDVEFDRPATAHGPGSGRQAAQGGAP